MSPDQPMLASLLVCILVRLERVFNGKGLVRGPRDELAVWGSLVADAVRKCARTRESRNLNSSGAQDGPLLRSDI